MLANNIETTQPETLKVEVISNAPHSIPLEFGTSKMQARPFMRPAALKKQGEAARLVSAAVARNARKRT
jgi:HK97 gp10 family phage protein